MLYLLAMESALSTKKGDVCLLHQQDRKLLNDEGGTLSPSFSLGVQRFFIPMEASMRLALDSTCPLWPD